MGSDKRLQSDDVVAGKYVIEEPLGEGGMGAVFLAHHSVTGRRVALKVLHTQDGTQRARLLREARALGRLSHPNVVGVIDAGEHDGSIFVVMDYVHGKNLRAFTEGRVLSVPEALDLLIPAMCGVAAAHQANILHRDLKPENLFVCTDIDGVAFDTKVLDFGVAKSIDDGDTALTSRGTIIGTPRYMAPEQITQGDSIDGRTDVYALGVILYELLTGRLPYKNTKAIKSLVIEILAGQLDDPRKHRAELPDELCEVMLCALATERGDRYPNVAAFARALERFAGSARFEEPRQLYVPDVTLDSLRAPALGLTATVDMPTPQEASRDSSRKPVRIESKSGSLERTAPRRSPRPQPQAKPADTEPNPTLEGVVRTSAPAPSNRRGLVVLTALVLAMIFVGIGWGAFLRERRAEHASETSDGPHVVQAALPPAKPSEAPAPVAPPPERAQPVAEPTPPNVTPPAEAKRPEPNAAAAIPEGRATEAASARPAKSRRSRGATSAGHPAPAVTAQPTAPTASPAPAAPAKREINVRGGTLRREDF